MGDLKTVGFVDNQGRNAKFVLNISGTVDLYINGRTKVQNVRDLCLTGNTLHFNGKKIMFTEKALTVGGENPRQDINRIVKLCSKAANPTEVLCGVDRVRCFVYVRSGTDLRPADVGGKSDPYVMVGIAGEKESEFDRTSYKSRTLNPEWNEYLEVLDYSLGQDLEFVVMDHDFMTKDDYLGSARVKSKLLANRKFEGQLALYDDGKHGVLGSKAFITGHITVRVDILAANDARPIQLDDPMSMSTSRSRTGPTGGGDHDAALLGGASDKDDDKSMVLLGTVGPARAAPPLSAGSQVSQGYMPRTSFEQSDASRSSRRSMAMVDQDIDRLLEAQAREEEEARRQESRLRDGMSEEEARAVKKFMAAASTAKFDVTHLTYAEILDLMDAADGDARQAVQDSQDLAAFQARADVARVSVTPLTHFEMVELMREAKGDAKEAVDRYTASREDIAVFKAQACKVNVDIEGLTDLEIITYMRAASSAKDAVQNYKDFKESKSAQQDETENESDNDINIVTTTTWGQAKRGSRQEHRPSSTYTDSIRASIASSTDGANVAIVRTKVKQLSVKSPGISQDTSKPSNKGDAFLNVQRVTMSITCGTKTDQATLQAKMAQRSMMKKSTLQIPQQTVKKMRKCLQTAIYHALEPDFNEPGISSEKMRKFAELLGYICGDDEWYYEWEQACSETDWNPEVGVTKADLLDLLDDPNGCAYCSTWDLENLVDELMIQASAKEAGVTRAPRIVCKVWKPHTSAQALRNKLDRKAMLTELFDLLYYNDKRGKLGLEDWQLYAELCGFEGTDEEWDVEWDEMAREFRFDRETGTDRATFARIVSQPDTAPYSSDNDLNDLVNIMRTPQPYVKPKHRDNIWLLSDKTVQVRMQRKKEDLLKTLFDTLDDTQNGRLGSDDLRRYAEICGFNGDDEEWAIHYGELCMVYKISPKTGADLHQFYAISQDKGCHGEAQVEELVADIEKAKLERGAYLQQASSNMTPVKTNRTTTLRAQTLASANRGRKRTMWKAVSKNFHMLREFSLLLRHLFEDAEDAFAAFTEKRFGRLEGPTFCEGLEQLNFEGNAGGVFKLLALGSGSIVKKHFRWAWDLLDAEELVLSRSAQRRNSEDYLTDEN